MLGKSSEDNIQKYFSYFSKKTICMKCQSLYSGKNKNSNILLSAELAQRVVDGNRKKYL